MKSIKQKFMAVLLCCLLAASTLLTSLAAFPVTAEAAEDAHPFTFNRYSWYVTGLCEKGETPSGDVVIPGTFTYNGVKYKVTNIEASALGYHNTKVTSVTIPSTVQSIGSSAFSGCTKLKSVTISKGAKLSSINGFSDCTALKEIYINTEKVGAQAFWGCTSLSKVTFGDNVKEIEEDAFYGCTALKSITFGKNITTIGDYAFANTALKSITFGKNITTIGGGALYGCSKLESITIGENVTTLGVNIADGCSKLKRITVKSTKLEVENCWNVRAPFGNLSEEVKITVPDGKSEEYGFLWTNNWNWVDEDGYVRFAITSDNAYMTGICKEGEKPSGAVKIPETFTYDGVNYKVVKIQDDAFRANKKITSVEIPSTVTEIGGGAFGECSKLKTVTMPKNSKLSLIDGNAFYECTSLREIYLGAEVTEIGRAAFYNCSKLKTVTISKKAKLSIIEEFAFYGCTALKEIYINAETVGDVAFDDCTSLSKVTFGSNVKKIGDAAFNNTAIKSITFGKNITTIGIEALCDCKQLEEITIGENVTTLGGGIDRGCEKLKTITVKSTKLNAVNYRTSCSAYNELGQFIFTRVSEYPFLNASKKETIKVPKNKLAAYKKLLGEGDDAKITYKTF